jgi:hypothetical protein
MTGSEGGRAMDAGGEDRAAARRRIVEAACALIAGGRGAAMIDAAALQAAGVCGRGECERHFIDTIELRSALFNALFTQARDRIISATHGMRPGLLQLETLFETYLDYSLAHPALQDLAHALQLDPRGQGLLLRTQGAAALVARAALSAAGCDLAEARAQLLTAMVVSVARAEYRGRRKLTELRRALMAYCESSAGAAAVGF